MDIYLASGNAHKLSEIQAMLSGLNLTLHSAKALGGMPFVDESADDFAGNALLKAQGLESIVPEGAWVLADDSGLCVKALNGAPGVRSARYAGEDATDADNNAKLLSALEGLQEEQRGAAFHCVFCLLGPDSMMEFSGKCPGHLLSEPKGADGFGYDPLFVPEGETRTFAEMADHEKNQISHRAKAVAALRAWLAKR